MEVHPSHVAGALSRRRRRREYVYATATPATPRRAGPRLLLRSKILCGGFRGLVDFDALVPVHLHVDDHVGLAEVVDEGRVDGLRAFVATRVEVDLLGVRA